MGAKIEIDPGAFAWGAGAIAVLFVLVVGTTAGTCYDKGRADERAAQKYYSEASDAR